MVDLVVIVVRDVIDGIADDTRFEFFGTKFCVDFLRLDETDFVVNRVELFLESECQCLSIATGLMVRR